MKRLYHIAILMFIALNVTAQDSTNNNENVIKDSTKKNKNDQIKIGFGSDETTDSSDKIFDIHIGILDIGVNNIRDKTDYNSAQTQNFLHVDQNVKNENLFSLRAAKSINVNIYPVLLKYRMVKTELQRVYASIGIGLQIYNFRFSKPITYENETLPMVVMDTVLFQKNKVAITYLSVPLMITAKTKLAKNIWLVYGLGVTGGYRISSLTKQISDERGKQKNRDQFNFNNFNACVTGEIGLDGYVRLFASYQLTPLHENSLEQYPYSIGLRFFGI